MFLDDLIADLMRDECPRLKPYDDATGKELKPGDVLVGNITIGVGRNLSGRGIAEDEMRAMLKADIAVALADLACNVPWVFALPEGVQLALANMAFNMGWPRLAQFHLMWAALEAHDFATAAAEAQNSTWFKQVGERGSRIVALLKGE